MKIEIYGLRKRLGEKEVLRGIDLVIHPGELVTIIGGSGSGKSVLLKHIVGLFWPDEGEIVINETPLRPHDKKFLSQFRRRLGMVFQHGALLRSLTLKENLALPLTEHQKLSPLEIQQKVEEVLSLVNLRDFIDYYPSDLSGGMIKRASIARALITQPQCVLYDEPTSGLDPLISYRIHSLIREISDKFHTTTIVVSHDIPQALRISDRIAFLYEGRIYFDGTPEALRQSTDPIIREFLNSTLTV